MDIIIVPSSRTRSQEAVLVLHRHVCGSASCGFCAQGCIWFMQVGSASLLFPVSPSPSESAKTQPCTSEQARLLQDMRLAAVLAHASVPQPQPASACIKLQGFDDPQVAFSAKSTGQLLQSLAVFRTCSVKPLVQNADVLLAAAKKVVGPAVVTSVVRHTFFKHFCGGKLTS